MIKYLSVGVPALAVAALAACSSGSTSIATTASAPASAVIAAQGTAGVPANPVPLLLKTGAKQSQNLPPETDIYGDRFASGTVDNGNEQVTAWTFASQAAQQADLARNTNPSDGSRTIEGNLWAVSVTPVTAMNGDMTFPVSLASIAAKVGGTVVGG
jgi:hypothetical protein